MTALSRLLSRLSLWFSALGLVAMTGIIGWQVAARYLLGDAPAWAEQAALLLMLWFILFAAATGVREGFHIRLSLLQDTAPDRYRKPLSLLCHTIVGAFGLGMTAGGWQLMSETWHHVIPTLGLSRALAYIPLTAAGVLIVFFASEHIAAEARGQKVEPLWN